MVVMGAYGGPAWRVDSGASETMLLWGLGQPTSRHPNAFARQGAPAFPIDACGRRLTLHQQPSSFRGASGVTGTVAWDSAVVHAKFLEHAADSGLLPALRNGARTADLGAGCGLVAVVAALVGARVVATDLPNRIRLLRKNIEENVTGMGAGSATVAELVWGDEYEVDPELLLDTGLPELVLGSDVVYSEEAVGDLLATLTRLAGPGTTMLLAGELRNAERSIQLHSL